MKDEEKKREKKEKGHEQLLHILFYSSSPPRASNQPTNRFCSVAMTNVTHTTIFRLHRSGTPTPQNQSI
jgi:hypothetical protein